MDETQGLTRFRTDEFVSLTLPEGKFQVQALDLVRSFSGVDEMYFNIARVLLPDGTVYHLSCGPTYFSGTNNHTVLAIDLARLTRLESKVKSHLDADQARRLRFALATPVV